MTKKILIVGPSWIGDMVMAQSVFKLLKQKNPDCLIDVIAPKRTLPLLERMVEVNKSIEAPFIHYKFEPLKHYYFAKQIRKEHYNQAIILPNSLKSALSPWLAGIKKRTGWKGEHRYGFINDLRHLDKKTYPLLVERYLALALEPNETLPNPYPYPQLVSSQEQIKSSLARCKPIYRGRPILALCIGATYGPAKKWPAQYFSEVAKAQIRAGWDVWLMGSPEEESTAKQVMELINNQGDNLTTRTSLAECIDLFSLVTGVVTNDTGLMHIAAALKKQLIVLYGSSTPEFTPPLCNNATTLSIDLNCRPCFKRTCVFGHYQCLNNLKPEKVLSAIAHWNNT